MIAIRALQHYMYCPHRWGLLYIGNSWQDNVFTVNAEIIHRRVDSGTDKVVGAKRIYSDVAVYDDRIGIYGKVDCIEIRSDGDCKSVDVVEYKPTMPKSGNISPAEKLQVFAQYLCAKNNFGGNVRAFVYYADVRRRVKLSFGEEDASILNAVVTNIRRAIETGVVPPAEKSDKCRGCSLSESCMPGIEITNVKKRILEETE